MAETPENRPANAPFRGAIDGKPFTSENQPAPEQKSAGWAKKKRGAELAKLILNLPFKGAKDSKIKELAAEYFGVPQDEVTVEQVMTFRQAEKAIQKADTQAYKILFERAYGYRQQDIVVGEKLTSPTATVTIVDPHATAPEEKKSPDAASGNSQ